MSSYRIAAPVNGDRRGAQTIDFNELLAILARRIVTIALVVALFLALAVFYIITADVLYTATTSILVDPRQGRSLSVETTPNLTADTGQLESQLKLVTSQTVLRRVVETEKLLNDDEFGAPKPRLMQRIFSVIARTVPAPTQLEKLDAAVDALSKNITVRRSERTYVIDIQVSSMDAAKSARLANAVAKAYMDDASEARSEAIRLETDYVQSRLLSLQGRLQEAEERVAIFKEKNKIFDASGKLVNDEQINSLSNSIVEARTKTAESRARYEQVKRAIKSGKSIETVGDAQKSVVLERLRTQAAEITRLEANLRTTLGPRHPQLLEVQQQAIDTRRLINEELRRIAVSTENDFQVARDSEASLEAELNRLRAIAGTTNQALPQLRELERNVDAQRAAFEKLSKAGDTISQQGADTPIARVIAMALAPDAPSSPKKIPILAIALVAGLGFGIGTALLMESLHRQRLQRDFVARFKDGEATTIDGSASVLSAIRSQSWLARLNAKLRGWRLRRAGALSGRAPARSAASGMGVDRLPRFAPSVTSPYSEAVDEPGSAFATACRTFASEQLTIIANLAGPSEAPRFIYVTSIEAGVGKSVLAANFAEIAAAAGARVLIIDANRVNPSLSLHGTETGTLGAITAMGRVRPAFAFEGDGDGYIVILAASADQSLQGRRLEALPRLLDGDIDQNFDLVIIDSAALDQSASAKELVATADRVFLVGDLDILDTASVSMASKALDCDAQKIQPIAIEHPSSDDRG